tara:strand:+ start:2500 stop:3189 length:690 start_codon:yes stop_codon:yes gene_type:complete
MAFWSDKIVEPKRKFRWLLSINGIPYWTIKKVNRPTYEVAEAEHKFINHTFYFPGRVTYNTVSFTIVDTSSPDAAETLKQMLYGAGYALPKDENVSTQTITKHGGVTALGDVNIELIGGGGKDSQTPDRTADFGASTGNYGVGYNDEGTVLEKWKLHNAWIKKIEFSELDYDGDDLAEITVELRYDYAELNGKNIGAVFGALNKDATRQPDKLNGGYEVGFDNIPKRQD